MIQGLKNKRFIIFFTILTAIVLANYSLYRLPIMDPLPNGIALASIVDFMLVIPIMAYFFIIRKKYALKYMGLVILAGYGVAWWIVPNDYLQQYRFLPYLVITAEGLFVLVELYILFKGISALPKLWGKFKRLQQNSSFFRYNLQQAVTNAFPKNKILTVLATDISLFYYALFSWKKKPETDQGDLFSYHKKTSCIAVYIMLIHALVLETVVIHIFIHQWNIFVSVILLLLNIYTLIFFVAEIQAIRLTPFLLTNKKILMQVGFAKGLEIHLSDIKSFHRYEGPAKLSRKEQKGTFFATVADLEMEPAKPQFEIEFQHPLDLHFMYGLKKQIQRVIFNVDDAERFEDLLTEKLSSI